MAKSDPMLARIRAFDRARGGGVAVERANKGYSLFSVATGAPLARLRPTGRDDEVESSGGATVDGEPSATSAASACRSMTPSATSLTTPCSGREPERSRT